MQCNLLKAAMLVLPALALSACGGDGGGGVESTPPPPPPPPTPAPPPPPPGSDALEAVNILPSPPDGAFAVLGLETNGSPTLKSTGFAVSYDAAKNLYQMDFPTAQAGYFFRYANDTSSQFWNGTLASADKTNKHDLVSVAESSYTGLQYTSFAMYDLAMTVPTPFGFVAFGTPTPSSAMPVSGSASYDALVRGATVDGGGYITGSASLTFDFAAGSLSGHLDPRYASFGGIGEAIPLGTYSFTNTVYSSGSTTFSGSLSNPAVSGTGSFTGRFTGPSAQELMSSWSAPYTLNGSTSQMFGVWVGQKH